MNDYFNRLESQLAALTEDGAHLDPTPAKRFRWRLLLGAALPAVTVAAAIGVTALLLFSVRSHPPSRPPAVRHRVPGPAPGEILYPLGAVPTLPQLLANFAILRRAQTPADRSWQPQCDCAGSARQLNSLTRLAETLPGGYRVFLDVEQLTVGGQLNMAAGSYVLNLDIVGLHDQTTSGAFGPNVQYSVYPLTSGGLRARRSAATHSTVWASVVPDGVAAVAWTIGCPAGRSASRCSGQHPQTITVPVIDNVAARAITIPEHCSPDCSTRPQVAWRTLDGRVIQFTGFGNLAAPPFVKGWRGNQVLNVLRPDALGDARLGQSASSAIQTLERLLGPPADTNAAVSDCGIDHESVWTSPTVTEPLTIFQRAGRLVGYQYGAPASELGIEPEPGALLKTARGLTLGDTIKTARRLYGTRLTTSAAHGGVWSAAGHGGTLTGSVLPTSYPLRAVTDANPIATIDSGDTGCQAAGTP
jgi:hypothetical protein